MIARLAAAALALASALPAVARPVTVVAHRGLAAGLPENSLAAFRHAIAQGVEVIETDLRSTRDGEIVLLHDATVDRTTDGRGAIAGMTLTAVRRLDAGSHAGARFAGERVPTLAEALALVRGSRARLLLDIKDEKGVDLARVLRLVADHGLTDRVILGFRSARWIARARALDRQVAIIAFVTRPQRAAGAVAVGASIVRLWSDWIDDGRFTDRALIAAAGESGSEVWAMVGRKLPRRDGEWSALHARLVAAGVDGLITDRPELVHRSD